MEWRKAEDMPLSIKKKIEAELDNATTKARGIALFLLSLSEYLHCCVHSFTVTHF